MAAEGSELRRAARDLVDEHVAPHVERWERERHFPRELIGRIGAAGFFRGDEEERSAGPGSAAAALVEELGRSLAAGVAISVLAHVAMALPLLERLAADGEGRKWVDAARSGDALLGLAATEAESGSDMNAIETVARIGGGEVRLDGVKRYITNATQADALLVLARLDERQPPWSSALVLVPADTPGVTRTRLESSGLRCGDFGEVAFHDCRLPAESFLGEPGRGFAYLLAGLQRERILGALTANAMAGEVLRRTIARCRDRIRMDEPLIRKQAVRHRLAEQEARLEASRQLASGVADRFRRGEAVDREVWMLKVFCYETAQELIGVCAHLVGAEAFLEDHWMCRALRDSRAFSLAAGTSEIMKEMLAAAYDSPDGTSRSRT